MKHPYDATDYLFLSARLRARLAMRDVPDTEKLSAVSYEEIVRLLGSADTDAVLDRRMQEAFDLAQEFSPDPSFIRLFAYPYDCQNLKLSLKYSLRSAKDTPDLFPYGTVLPSDVRSAVQKRDFSAFPPAMAEAAQRALSVFEKSGDIQKLDLILDRAAFADMSAAAREFGCPFLIELIRYRIDCYHLNAFCRFKDLGMDPELFPELFCDGGNLPLSFFTELSARPIADLIRALKARPEFAGDAAIKDLSEDADAAAFEAALDRFYTDQAAEQLNATYGAEPVIAYLVCEEARIKELRKLIASKRVFRAGGSDD